MISFQSDIARAMNLRLWLRAIFEFFLFDKFVGIFFHSY